MRTRTHTSNLASSNYVLSLCSREKVLSLVTFTLNLALLYGDIPFNFSVPFYMTLYSKTMHNTDTNYSRMYNKRDALL